MCEQVLLMVTWLNNAQFTKLHTDTTYSTVPWKYREYTLKGKEQGRNRFKQEMNEVKMHMYQPTPPLTHTSVCRVWSSHRGVICLLHENRERWHWCDNETHPAAQTNSLSFPNWQVIRKQSAADWPPSQAVSLPPLRRDRTLCPISACHYRLTLPSTCL